VVHLLVSHALEQGFCYPFYVAFECSQPNPRRLNHELTGKKAPSSSCQSNGGEISALAAGKAKPPISLVYRYEKPLHPKSGNRKTDS